MDLALYSQVIGFGAFLWLAFFILSRADRQRPQTIFSFLALFTTALLFFSIGLINHVHGGLNPTLVRAFWWTDAFPMALWLHMSSLIVRPMARPLFSRPVIVSYGVALFVSLSGIFSDFYIDYSHAHITFTDPPGQESYLMGPGILYWTFTLFLLAAGLGALFNIGRSMRGVRSADARSRALLGQLRLLFVGGLLFTVSGVYLALRQQTESYGWPEEIGDLILVVGLALLGYSIANYDTLVEGKNIRRDFAYGLTGIIVINVVYVLLLNLTGQVNYLMLYAVVGLATTSHTLFDFGREQLDRLFFSRAEQQARSDARAYATALASTPVTATSPEPALALEIEGIDPEDEKAFNNVVRRAITSLKNPTQLVKSQLLTLNLIEQRVQQAKLDDNRLNRATVLRELLLDSIEQLRPTGLSESSSIPGTGDAWRFYNVLYFPYVREISRKNALVEARRLEVERKRIGGREPSDLEQVLNWLTDVDEDTFYKWQRRASDTIASLLREEELRLHPAKVAPESKPAKMLAN